MPPGCAVRWHALLGGAQRDPGRGRWPAALRVSASSWTTLCVPWRGQRFARCQS